MRKIREIQQANLFNKLMLVIKHIYELTVTMTDI